jgi:Kef-type K+ transport system membrane component KefB
VLGWLEADLAVQTVALLGLAMLLFLAGLEVDVHRLRGRLLVYAMAGYALSVASGLLAGGALSAAGWGVDAPLLAVALSATSLGLVVAVLKDGGLVTTRLGQTVIAASSVADFAAVVLLSLVFSGADAGEPAARALLLVRFVGLVVVVGAGLALSARSQRVGSVLLRLQDGTAEIRIRVSVVLVLGFVVLAEEFGLESILGAFLAGAAVGLVDRDSASHPHYRLKLEAIGYGFLVPVFFVASGLRLDVSGLVDSPQALARVPVFVVLLLLARGLPAVLYLRWFGPRRTAAAALLQATSLPFIVTATQIGVVTGGIDPVTAAALVCAGLVSVLVFPLAATYLLGDGVTGDRAAGDGGARRVDATGTSEVSTSEVSTSAVSTSAG